MQEDRFHWIALYLSGQFPGQYRLPDRLGTVFAIRRQDPTNFSDTVLSLLKEKSDWEFYHSLLKNFQIIHGDQGFNELLETLSVPRDIQAPYRNNTSINLSELDKYISTLSEEEFGRYIVMPLLHAMGYKDVIYKGKVHETDVGTDFYVVKFQSPGKIEHYAGVQVKAKRMSNGDTSTTGSELNKLISEAGTCFTQLHNTSDGNSAIISEYIVFNSVDVPESAVTKFKMSTQLRDKKVRYYDRDGTLSLILEYRPDISIDK